jgi:hypothetical protein
MEGSPWSSNLLQRLPGPASFLLVSLITLGCTGDASEGQSEPPSDSAVFRWDSAGVSIIVTEGSAAYAPIGWEVDSVPTTVIGAGEDPSTQLYRVQGVRDWAEGGLLIVDGGSRELRFFDSAGHLQYSVGGRGEGPGEFQDPWLLGHVGTDSLFVWDMRLRRLQGLSSDGEDPRLVRLGDWPFGAGWRAPPGIAGHQLLLAMRNILTPAYSQTAGAKEDSVAFVWYDPVSSGLTPLDSLTYSGTFIHLRPGRPPAGDAIPFSVVPTAVVSPNGAVVTSGQTPEIREYGFHSDLRSILRIDAAARPVTRIMVEAWTDQRVANSGASREALEPFLSELPFPDSLPAFQNLKVDADGFLWARVFQWDPARPMEWVVFNPEGRALGSVETPVGLSVEWIGPEYVSGVWKDNLGVEYVHRYRIRRPTTWDSDSGG